MTSTINPLSIDDLTDFDFVIRLNRAPDDNETNQLYDGGLDDALIGGIDMYVTRRAPNLPTAVGQVVGQISNVPGLHAVGVSHSFPVGALVPEHEQELLGLLDSLIRARASSSLTAAERTSAAALLTA